MNVLSREAAASLYRLWRDEVTDPALSRELAEIEGDADAIYDRFFAELAFGTGGLRGKLGAGSRRMNLYTVAKATRGLAAYIKKSGLPRRVAIAYDSRINSKLFADVAANILTSEKIFVCLYPRLMPTPALSYAVRTLGCGAGIVMTASHNPAVYNGYKVYGPDGCQITLEAARAITEEIEGASYFGDMIGDEAYLSYIGEEVVDGFLADASACVPVGCREAQDLRMVYTPLCGAGKECVTRLLALRGFDCVTVVPSQAEPDGNFPGLPYPNPEMPEALAEGLALCRKTNADLLLATDPDCDRVGIAVRDGDDYTLLTGNECGCVLLAYLLECRKLPAHPVVVKTIVTTDLASEMAKAAGAELREVLTGFKFIGEQIGELEKAGEVSRYLFGFEESCGYLCGTYVRDKDGVSASLLICEAARYYKAKGMTLCDKLRALCEQFGYHAASLTSLTLEGSDGIERMGAIMQKLRANPPEELCGRGLEVVEDYKLGVRRVHDAHRVHDPHRIHENESHTEEKLTLPVSDVLKLRYAGGLSLTARPSGTEPKMKFYIAVAEQSEEASREMLSAAGDALANLVK